MSKTKRNKLGLILCCLFPCILIVGCFSSPEMQVEKSLDARQSALNARDVDSYIKLFHPDYRYRGGEVETITSKISKRFSAYQSIHLSTSNRRITFEENGDIARVVQQFRMVTVDKMGNRKSAEGNDHFLLKRKRSLVRSEYLFFEGLGV
jgi:hypothetical protein